MLKKYLSAGFLAAVGLLAAAFAQADTIVIEAAQYLDVVQGRMVSPAVIVVDGDRITAINPAVRPANARTIDLGGHTLLPGLMDSHTHLNYDIVEGWETEAVRFTAGDFALRGAANARKTLQAGFTTVRDLGTGLGFSDVALQRAIDQGWVIGPRMIPAGHALSITGGHCDLTGFGPGIEPANYVSGVADGVDEVLKAVRYQIKYGAKVIKICATAGVLSFEGSAGAQQYSLEELRAAAEEVHRHGLRIAAHAHGTEGIIASSQAGIDSIEHNSIMTEEAAGLLKKSGTFVVPNMYLNKAIDLSKLPPAIAAKMNELKPVQLESFRRALAHQLKISFGTDAGVFPHGENAREFAAQVALGQTPLGAIRSATIVNAELFGTPDRGRIEAGLLADLIAVEGNPLENIALLEDVRFVMKGGVVYQQPESRPGAAASWSTDEAEIRAMLAASVQAFNRGDLPGHLAIYDPAVTFMTKDGPRPGIAPIEAAFRQSYFRDRLPKQQLGFEQLAVRPLGADQALATGRFVLAGGGEPDQTGWFTLVWLRTGAGWRAVHDHSS